LRGGSCHRPGQRFETEVEHAIQFIEGDAHFESGFGGDEAVAASFLQRPEEILGRLRQKAEKLKVAILV